MKEYILSVTAIAEVFPNGQKITAAAVEFDRDIDNEKLATPLFSVKNRNITRIYANVEPARAAAGRNGKFVILELSLEDAEAQVLPKPSPRAGGPVVPGGQGGQAPNVPLRSASH